MQKRAIQRIPDVSSGIRYTFCRHRSGTSGGTRRSTTLLKEGPFGGGRERGRERGHANQPVSEELKKVLSPEALAWLEGKPLKTKDDVKGKGKGRVTDFQRPTTEIPPSKEKQLFTALDEPHDLALPESSDVDAFVDETRRIPAGTLVELRRADITMNAVVLYTMLYNRKWVMHALTSVGEVWHCHEHDVTFQLTNFVDEKLIERCGLFERAETEAESDARVQVLSKLRSFEKRFEHDCHAIPEIANGMSFYDQVAHSDPTVWSPLTTREAAVKLLGKDATLTDVDLFAVQSYLFASGHLYVVETSKFLEKQLFWVRPRQEVSDIEAVTEMVLNRSPALDVFAAKARKVIAESRQRSIESWEEAPSRRPLDDVEWTEGDRTILRFLVSSLRTHRLIQKSPFTVPVAHILKAVGMHSMKKYNGTAAHHFLIELGMLAPWDEPISREIQLHHEADSVDLTPTVPTPILPSSLGPTDLYSHDVVESLRHDFGDLPVYVIDDWGAEELDDGISVERIPSDPEHHWLHVHIADPTTLLPPSHEIARHAMQLSTTRYWVDRTIPMLPRDTALSRFSLDSQQGQPNVALSFSMKVNTSGKIVDYKVRPAVVRNVRTIKYDMVDALLGNESGTTHFPFGGAPQRHEFDMSSLGPPILDDLKLLQQVTQRLEADRLKNNALVFSLPRPNMIIEPRPLPSDIMSTSVPSEFRGFPKLTYGVANALEMGSRVLVAEAMRAAGRAASLFFRDRGIPAIRRTVAPLQTELRGKIEELLASRGPGGVVDPYVALAARVISPPGQYVLTPSIHALMGIPEGEGYMKVTSPLRRFGDMIAHWQIKHALLREKGERGAPVLFDEAWLLRAAEDLSLREQAARQSEIIQQSFWAHWFLIRWMNDPRRAQREHDPLRTLKARLVEAPTANDKIGEMNCAVYLSELGLKARLVGVPLDQTNRWHLGDELDVDIHQVLLGTRPSLDVTRR
ncbi:RNB-domain-containing protein [Dichomitus squalens LYAD-421 SS1]|uniref:RNB-domain-containing protein n=1 Tax=Dichomitus squalens (strain LYAD-421) TaxID=732165 RepID=UPI0004413C9B|nr:RNB-domain-containing protein [Dichomitus squalens LYAD-421 SS1]EJF64548.1 RNB-domain-containing protein [Dichomitus squalens LYAD-421 SS1]